MDDQLITAQTLAQTLVLLRPKLHDAEAQLKALQASESEIESKLLDSLPDETSITYGVGNKAVTVSKRRGDYNRITVTDLIL